jgi:FkbM family methyltransferase
MRERGFTPILTMLIPFDYLCKKYRLRPPGVLHLGANEGQEAAAYAAAGIRRVVWVEALPELFDALRAKAVANYPGSVALLACLSDVDNQQVQFNVASNGGQSSSFLELGTHAQAHPTVRYVKTITMVTTRVDTLLRQNNLEVGPGWLLNVDLQGAELHALQGMPESLQYFDSIYIEVNIRELYKGCPLAEDIDFFLFQRGFERKEIKMTGSGWGDAFYLRV